MDYKGTTNANPVNDIQTRISSLTERKGNIFLKPKMTERMASGWMTVWRLDTGELKRFGKAQSRWWKQRYNLGRYHQRKAEEMQIEALKEAYEELRKCGEEYHFRSDT